jgi:GAF domain-containing protein
VTQTPSQPRDEDAQTDQRIRRTAVAATASDFAEIAAELAASDTVDDTVDKIVRFAVQAVGCWGAGVVFVHGESRMESLASSDPVVAELDEMQLQLGEGPDLDLVRSQHTLMIEDTLTEPRWPVWAAAAAERGVRSMVGTRLYVSDHVMGSLNVYDSEPGHFSDADRQVVEVLARHAAIALNRAWDSAHLLRALDSRKVIGMAEGILMERLGLDDEQAFNVLRRYSQNQNMKLRDVAQVVVDTRRLPG